MMNWLIVFMLISVANIIVGGIFRGCGNPCWVINYGLGFVLTAYFIAATFLIREDKKC